MKKLSWLLLILTLVSCGPAVVVTPTVTPSPSSTSMLPTATSTAIPATTTDVPTLPAEDARQRLLALLANNNDCRLPCLWGITPGKSNYQEARGILIPLSSLTETKSFDLSYPGDYIEPEYIEGDFRLKSTVSYLYDGNGIISRVRFRVVEHQLSQDEYGNQLTTPIYGSPEFIQRVEYYSLSHLMSEQGIPTSVMISWELTYENNRRSFLISNCSRLN